MDVSRIRALRGPNLWTRNTAVEALVMCESEEEKDLSIDPQFEIKLRNLFPGIGPLRTDQKSKITIAHAIESAALHLQIEAGCPVTFSRTTKTPEDGFYQVAVEYSVEEVGKMAINFAIDQIILGFVLNVLVYGITDFLYKKLLIPYQATWNSGPTLAAIKIPILWKIPLVGPILFDQSIIVYLMYGVVFLISFSLFKTKWGLRTRAVGEHPTAADSVGIKVNRLRFMNVMIAGMVAGLGGAYFTVGGVGAFNKEMTAGKGFIALAALIFGRWTPWGAVSAALLFGFADNLQSVLGIIGTPIPSEFMLMVPYLVTVVAVTGFVGRVRAPAADGTPYKRGESH